MKTGLLLSILAQRRFVAAALVSLAGAACCVPTLILVIGLQLTATVAAAWSLLVPASALLLALSLWWSLRWIAAEGRAESLPLRRDRACARRQPSRR